MIYDKFRDTICEEQHGFIDRRSACSNLVIMKTCISDALEKCSQLDAVYTVFSKAFDSVNHDRLILKLSAISMGEPLVSWL